MLAPPAPAGTAPGGSRVDLALLGQVVEPPGTPAQGPALGQQVSEGSEQGREPTWEITTAADDEIVAHLGARVARRGCLSPGSEHTLCGQRARTLPRPPGERLATVATVNDLHFGETEAGSYEGPPPMAGVRVGPGEPPHPETMNRAAAQEVAAIAPDAVVAKGDLTDAGRPEELSAFRACWEATFGSRLHWVAGNHDVLDPGHPLRGPATAEIRLPGLVVALLDTAVSGSPSGRLSPGQLEWLDELAARAGREAQMVLVLAHHHPWNPSSRTRPEGYFGINPTDSEALVALVARRPAIVAYAAGHTHRNRVRRFAATGDLPWIEVAALKDFPGSWAEYRVFEGGVLQVYRRISTPAALDWSERCRAILGGWYPSYALGSLDDRCLAIWPRGAAHDSE